MTDYIATDTELTSVANAIRTKRGTNAQLSFPTEFVSAINAISGGGDKAEPNDVMFIDYDGTILYSYSASDFLQLTEMPANPDRTSEGLTAEGWNYSLANAKTSVQDTGYLIVGQTYVPTDGCTHIFISIDKDDVAKSFNIAIQQATNTSAIIYWGDGDRTQCTTKSLSTYPHTYQNSGNYEIIIDKGTNTDITFGNGGQNYTIVGYIYHAYSYKYRSYIYKAQIGPNVKLNDYCFYYMYNLKTITIPSSIQYLGGNCFQYCSCLQSIVLPPYTLRLTSVPTYCFSSCSNLTRVSLPYDMALGTYAFYQCYGLNYISLNSQYYSITYGTACFSNCTNLKRIGIPSAKQTIGSCMCSNCYSLSKITIPSNIQTLNSNCFSNCAGVHEYHLKPTTPPSLSSTNAISSLSSTTSAGFVIYVPRSTNNTVLDTYKTASNWSTYSSYMQEEPA